MSTTIYHNPNCSTSRKVLALLREHRVEPEIVEYLKTPLTRAALAKLVAQLGMPARGLLRRKEPLYKTLALDNSALSDDAALDAMATHPVLMERPVVVTPQGARLCRPVETVVEILPRRGPEV